MIEQRKIKFLTIHCAATPEGRKVSSDDISKWDIAKFGQISYHWVIELDGTAVRTLPDHFRGAHVGGHNTGNIGVCYVGGVDKFGKPKDTRTSAQIEAMRKIVLQYKRDFPGIKILGHRDWSPDLNGDGKLTPNEWKKACPSFDVREWLKTLEN